VICASIISGFIFGDHHKRNLDKSDKRKTDSRMIKHGPDYGTFVTSGNETLTSTLVSGLALKRSKELELQVVK
jgi:hypothetical protein